MRAIVMSDPHGQLRLFENTLDHCGYDKDKDRLIIAGDLCDIGPHTMELFRRAEEEQAEILVGNHEIAHLCGIKIQPYDDTLDPLFIGFIGLGIDAGIFEMMAEHDGVLISHAGLSKKLVMRGFTENGNEDSNMKVHYESGTLTAAVAAEHFNERLRRRVHIRELEHDDGVHHILDVDGDPMWTDWFYPFWFRPYNDPDWGAVDQCGFYDGFKQVVGHTPVGSFTIKQQRLIAESGTYLIDPYARKYFDKVGHCRYAVIEDGNVTVVMPTEEEEV